MSTLAAGRKKQIETLYVEEARRASSIFPGGALAPFENPDFMLPAENGILGIEVTELCWEKPRTEAATLAKIPAKAETLYNSLEGSAPIDVNVAFSRRATDLAPKQLINSLVDFIYARRNHRGKCASSELPEGYCHIGIHEPHQQIDPTGRWHGIRSFKVEIASKQLIERCIAKKNVLLAKYRDAATAEVWLLIVNDKFLGPGEVYVPPDQLAEWKFSFDFEKVLLFAA